MPAGSTYTPIANTTIGTAVSTFTFSSIPSTYTDIVMVVQSTSSGEIQVRFNSDSGNNYSATEIWGPNGSSVVSQREANISYITLRDSSTTLGENMATMNIMNYSNATTNKTALVRTNDGRYNRTYTRVGMWRNTAAISSITLITSSGTFTTGSTFTLYGIAAA